MAGDRHAFESFSPRIRRPSLIGLNCTDCTEVEFIMELKDSAQVVSRGELRGIEGRGTAGESDVDATQCKENCNFQSYHNWK